MSTTDESIARAAVEQEIFEMYNDFKDYDEVVLEQYKYEAYRLIPGWIISRMQSRTNWPAQVLDLGCGTGLSSMEFFKQPKGQYNVTGVDLVPEMLERAAKRPYSRIITSNIETKWDIADNSLDACIMLGVLEFIRVI